MKLVNHIFSDSKHLEDFITYNIDKSANILVQIFSTTTQSSILTPILKQIKQQLPSANIIGASTTGEILAGKVIEPSIVISFSLFESTKISIGYYEKTNYENGIKAAQDLVDFDTKALIMFSEALNGDAEDFLNGFSVVNNSVVIAGGNAGDNYKFKKTIIIHDTNILGQGIVIASLSGNNLKVSNTYSLEWTPIGNEMTITKVRDNVVYEIDNRPILDIYKKYLGEDILKNLPTGAISFPLIKINDGIDVARSMIAKNDDGSLVYAGHFYENDKVKFAIGNVEQILNNAILMIDELAKNSVEAMYIYSCSVRNLYLKEQLNYEMSLLNNVAPSVGFFTYGEFYHSKSYNQLLNITTTVLALSESDHKPLQPKGLSTLNSNDMVLSPLTHLINTTQKELNETLHDLEQYKMALDASSILSKTDVHGIITYVNDKFCKISGYSRLELVGQNHNIIRHPDTPAEVFQQMWDILESGNIWEGTIKNRSKSGEDYYVQSVIIPIKDENNNIKEFIASRINVTNLVKKDMIIKKQYLDQLTGLKNRASLFDTLSEYETDVILTLINIDKFSQINDYFGFGVGDEILKQISNLLIQYFKNDRIFRISGDEFGLILEDNQSLDTIEKDILKQLNKIENYKFSINNFDIKVDLSSGVAKGSKDEIYKLAHIALKESTVSKKPIIYYNKNEKLSEKVQKNIEIVHTIKHAIENDLVVPYYQGIVDNKTGKIVKYESLMRIIDIDGNVLSPYLFLEQAKSSKLYDKLTRSMIQKVFKEFYGKKCAFSINLTLQDIMSKETSELLFSLIKDYKCENMAIIELVESEEINDFSHINIFIENAKKVGFKIAVDDFGSGYSNFSYLVNLQVDFIKIDGSIIKNILTDYNSQVILQSILYFAQKMKFQTIAEFVEDKEVYELLSSWGVDFSQGYYFSKPNKNIKDKGI